jgi:hypothetical protein
VSTDHPEMAGRVTIGGLAIGRSARRRRMVHGTTVATSVTSPASGQLSSAYHVRTKQWSPRVSSARQGSESRRKDAAQAAPDWAFAQARGLQGTRVASNTKHQCDRQANRHRVTLSARGSKSSLSSMTILLRRYESRFLDPLRQHTHHGGPGLFVWL